ncbi:MAG: DUF362 domain-containing protein [Chloroflexota bacterium]|nr:MAG: DUF362 domain-containing protein [Chloroflexota bacterium]
MQRLPRREFLRTLSLLGLGALTAGPLSSGCASGDQRRTAPVDVPTVVPPVHSSTAGAPAGPTPTATVVSPARERTPAPTAGQAYLSVVHGFSPAEITRAAIAALGGMGRFVKPGQEVIIKPNICVAYHSFEYAATTNPEVVATLVQLCLAEGAKRVRVMDAPFGGTAEQAYAKSGIGEAVKAAGGQMEVISALKFRDTAIPNGRDLKNWKVHRDLLETDVLIDVPIAKQHDLARLTLGMKNLMGGATDRERIHSNLGQRVADLTSLMRPTLTVVDAVRILLRNGPTGGSLNDVKKTDTIIASHDVVAADAQWC